MSRIPCKCGTISKNTVGNGVHEWNVSLDKIGVESHKETKIKLKQSAGIKIEETSCTEIRAIKQYISFNLGNK